MLVSPPRPFLYITPSELTITYTPPRCLPYRRMPPWNITLSAGSGSGGHTILNPSELRSRACAPPFFGGRNHVAFHRYLEVGVPLAVGRSLQMLGLGLGNTRVHNQYTGKHELVVHPQAKVPALIRVPYLAIFPFALTTIVNNTYTLARTLYPFNSPLPSKFIIGLSSFSLCVA